MHRQTRIGNARVRTNSVVKEETLRLISRRCCRVGLSLSLSLLSSLARSLQAGEVYERKPEPSMAT